MHQFNHVELSAKYRNTLTKKVYKSKASKDVLTGLISAIDGALLVLIKLSGLN